MTQRQSLAPVTRLPEHLQSPATCRAPRAPVPGGRRSEQVCGCPLLAASGLDFPICVVEAAREGPRVLGCVWRDLVQTQGADSWGSLPGRPIPGRHPQTLSSEHVLMEGRVNRGASVLNAHQPPSLVCERWPPTPAAPRQVLHQRGLILAQLRARVRVSEALGTWAGGRPSRAGIWAYVPGQAGWCAPAVSLSSASAARQAVCVSHRGVPGITPILQMRKPRCSRAR